MVSDIATSFRFLAQELASADCVSNSFRCENENLSPLDDIIK